MLLKQWHFQGPNGKTLSGPCGSPAVSKLSQTILENSAHAFTNC